jgi:NAD(P)-dependent dehydrogenase (short-subunit alcohol dehydrogenase family)
MLDVHVVGTLLCAQAALRRMQPRGSGHIVVIGSHAAHRSFTDCSGYTAAKAGQLGLVRVLAEEARPFNVRVTNLLAGATDTPIWDDRPGFDRTKIHDLDRRASGHRGRRSDRDAARGGALGRDEIGGDGHRMADRERAILPPVPADIRDRYVAGERVVQANEQ